MAVSGITDSGNGYPSFYRYANILNCSAYCSGNFYSTWSELFVLFARIFTRPPAEIFFSVILPPVDSYRIFVHQLKVYSIVEAIRKV